MRPHGRIRIHGGVIALVLADVVQQGAHPLVFRAVRQVAQCVGTFLRQQLVEASLQHQVLQILGVVSFRTFHGIHRVPVAETACLGRGSNSGMLAASFFTV